MTAQRRRTIVSVIDLRLVADVIIGTKYRRPTKLSFDALPIPIREQQKVSVLTPSALFMLRILTNCGSAFSASTKEIMIRILRLQMATIGSSRKTELASMQKSSRKNTANGRIYSKLLPLHPGTI